MQIDQWVRYQRSRDEGMGGGRLSLPVSRVRRGVDRMGEGVTCYRGRRPEGVAVASGRRWLSAGTKRSNKGTLLEHQCRYMLEGDTLAQGRRGLWGRGTLGFAAFWRLVPNHSSKVSMAACRLFGW